MTTPRPRRLAVVTGASTGIGRELAKQFATHDFDVVAVADEAEIENAAQELRALGAEVIAVQTDLARRDGVEEVVARVRATGRAVDALAINAGRGVSGDFATGPSVDEEVAVVNLNITSAVHLARELLPDMVLRGSGRVMFTSSTAATAAGPFQATYNASKSFLLSFSEALREELKDTGVTVTALMPGPTDTAFFDRADMKDTRVGAMRHKDDPADVAKDGFEAMMAGKDKVVAGSFLNRVQAAGAKILPEKVRSAMFRPLTEPGKAKPKD